MHVFMSAYFVHNFFKMAVFWNSSMLYCVYVVNILLCLHSIPFLWEYQNFLSSCWDFIGLLGIRLMQFLVDTCFSFSRNIVSWSWQRSTFYFSDFAKQFSKFLTFYTPMSNTWESTFSTPSPTYCKFYLIVVIPVAWTTHCGLIFMSLLTNDVS